MTPSVACRSARISTRVRPPAASIGGWLRGVQLLRVLWGAACLAAPADVAKGVARQTPDRSTTRVIRVLGARHVVQGATAAWFPSSRVLSWGATVDALHSATMVALGTVDPHRRRLAWSDGVIAAVWGTLTFSGSRRA